MPAAPSWLAASLPQPLLSAWPSWWLIGRLGEAEILLPLVLGSALLLMRQRSTRSLAWTWLGAIAAAAVLTTATKVAFLGWAIGYAPWQYSGLSGHAMFAAAALPVVLRVAVAGAPPRWTAIAVAAGYLLALLVAVARLKVGAHSVSEVLPGGLLGAAVSAITLRAQALPASRLPVWWAVSVLAWLMLSPLHAPPSRTHQLVTQLSLELSGRPAPYMRRTLWMQPQRSKSSLQSAP